MPDDVPRADPAPPTLEGPSAERPTANTLVLTAFVAMTIIAGVNFVGVKFTVAELDPFWGAAMRFGAAAFLLAWYAVIRRIPWPSGRALVTAAIYGILAFGISYAGAYYSLRGITAGLASVILATVPLFTLLFATMHGLERFTLRNVAGATIAVAGIAILLADQLAGRVSMPHLIVAFLMPLAIAESNIVVKRGPRMHPVTLNVVAMSVGTVLLFALSLMARERVALPTQPRTWLAVVYLILLGSVALFTLVLFVLRRWTASATSYQLVLTPIVAVAVASAIAGESFTWPFYVGGIVVLAGVYVAAVRPRRPRPVPTIAEAPRSASSASDAPRP